MNCSKTVRLFHLNEEGVLYNRKGHSVFISFHKNGTIMLYCHIHTYTHTYIRTYVYIYEYTYIHMYVQLLCCIKKAIQRGRRLKFQETRGKGASLA